MKSITILTIILLTSKIHARVPTLWNRSIPVDDKPVIIAVIDTGIDTNHQDLKHHLWINEGEAGLDANGIDKSNNQIDDDSNGYIDDLYGWNFVKNSPNVNDNHGHGTHVSGIIAGISKPKLNHPSLRPVKIMTLKYYDNKSKANDTLNNTIKSIEYAVQMGAHIINYSSGGHVFSPLEKKAIQKATEQGVLFITAAGNDGRNLKSHNYYPANYNLNNLYSVEAEIGKNRRLPSSNFGNTHFKAPGYRVYSTLPNQEYGYLSGTSQATAFISRKIAVSNGSDDENETAD